MWSSLRGTPSCIGEDTLVAFADGHAQVGTRDRIEVHVANCGECRTVLARAAGALGSPSESSAEHNPSGAPLAAGARVGRYVIERLLGRGAMGSVYAAVDPDLNRRIALKLLRADQLSEEGRRAMRARLLREAQAMARLSHPEVIAVHDVGAFGEELFVAMEYVEGETLRHWCAPDRHRSCAELLAVYERAGRGLAAAHQAGLVHRDFKPDNVLVGRDGRVRVTDFGLARSLQSLGGADPRSGPGDGDPSVASDPAPLTMTLTRTGTLIGTPAYMAPEQLRGGAADARSDVFSFCVALYEALYGVRPFAGATVSRLKQAICEGVVRSPPAHTDVPRAIRGVLLHGLRAVPEERYPSVQAVLDALQKAKAVSKQRRWAAGVVGTLGVATAAALLARGEPATSHAGMPAAPLAVAAVLPPVSCAASSSPASAPEASPSPPAPAPRPLAAHRAPESPPRRTASLPAGYRDLPALN